MPQRISGSRGSLGHSFLSFSSLTSRLRGVTSSSRDRASEEGETAMLDGDGKGNDNKHHEGAQPSEHHSSEVRSASATPTPPLVMQLRSDGDSGCGVLCGHHDAHRPGRYYTVEVTAGTAPSSNEYVRTSQCLLLHPKEARVATAFPLVANDATAQGDDVVRAACHISCPQAAQEQTANKLRGDLSRLREASLSLVQHGEALDTGNYERDHQCSSSSPSARHLHPQELIDEASSHSAPPLPRRAAAAGELTSRRERPFQEKSRLFLNGNMSASCFAQWGIGTTCRKGLKRTSANQDDFFVYCCDEWGLYGVFDGHGPGGHFISNFIQWHLPNIIHDQISTHVAVPHALTKSFLRVNSMLKVASEKQNFDSASSGSTASVVLHRRHENKLFVAHVGDSKIVLATRNKAGLLVAERLTREHRPDDPLEKRRIETCGGEVRRPAGHVPHRVFVKGRNYPGLAMSR